VVADIFSWEPTEKYGVVFFSYWLSHVPPTMFDAFWEAVRKALTPDGRFFFIDELKDAWRNEEHLREDFVHDPSVPIVRRPLLDGRTFNVVKVFWDPDELEKRLSELGWSIKVHAAGPFFCAEALDPPPAETCTFCSWGRLDSNQRPTDYEQAVAHHAP
jgi:SAM-dependent methyltransferase